MVSFATIARRGAGHDDGDVTDMARTVEPPAPTTSGKRTSVAERRAERGAQVQRERAARRRILLIVGTVAAIVVALGALYYLRGKNADQQLIDRARQLPAVADEGRDHVNDGTPLNYKHYPPSSGPHFNTPQPAGVYDKEVSPGNWIHSLEHGYVVVLLKCPNGCGDLLAQMRQLYDNELPKSQFGTKKLVVTTYSHAFSDPAKEAPITLLAWDHEEMLPAFDRDKILAFYKAYVDKGPELVP